MLDQLKQQAKRLKIELYALYLAYRDPRVPWYAKFFAACVVAYAFSPIDLIPDFIPILGYLDDLILIPLGIKLALKMIPQPIMSKYRKQVQTNLPNSKPKNWIAAVTIVIVWIVLAITTISWLLQLIR